MARYGEIPKTTRQESNNPSRAEQLPTGKPQEDSLIESLLQEIKDLQDKIARKKKIDEQLSVITKETELKILGVIEAYQKSDPDLMEGLKEDTDEIIKSMGEKLRVSNDYWDKVDLRRREIEVDVRRQLPHASPEIIEEMVRNRMEREFDF